MPQSTSVFGTVAPPAALAQYGQSGGLIVFLNSAMTLAIVVGGLWALVNMVMAGMQYIAAKGDPKQMSQVIQTFTGSFIGIAIMVLAPMVMGIIGLVFFKDATYFISPKIVSPGGTP